MANATVRAAVRTLFGAASAWALLASASALADSACVSDAERYCPGVPIGEGRVLTCLNARWRDLSSSCQQDIQKAQNLAREIDLACANDVWTWCRGTVPGGDRIRTCLWARWNDLSTTCRDKAAEVAEKQQQLWDECIPDAERLCPGMKPGDGKFYVCLKAQASKTSSGCQRVLR